MPEYATTEIAAKCRVSERTVQRWIEEGFLSAQKVRRNRYLVEDADIEKLVPKTVAVYKDELTGRVKELEALVETLPDRIERLEHRLAELENSTAYHSGEIETLVDGLEQRIEALEQAVARLTELLQAKETPKILKPPQPHYSAKATVQEEQSSSLPGDLTIATSFAKQHGIPESTLKRAMADGRLQATPGSWHVGRVIVRWALDARARAQFFDLYHEHPRFQACEECPHEESTP